ncbi:hypothetical protein TNCV_3814961 [Trichonephila clavipes]|nr:hypothetical protein TNCV_3814961 [Trichonephila clavipes]
MDSCPELFGKFVTIYPIGYQIQIVRLQIHQGPRFHAPLLLRKSPVRKCHPALSGKVTDLTIAYIPRYPSFGYGTSNTLDIAVINNFNFPYSIDSIPELSSDHNPAFLNFSLSTPIHGDNSRAFTTCWFDFRNNLKRYVRLSNFTGIRNPNELEFNVSLITSTVHSVHLQSSKSIENKHHTFTPNPIQDLAYLKIKNYGKTPLKREQQRLRHLLNTISTDSEDELSDLEDCIISEDEHDIEQFDLSMGTEQELEETCEKESTNKLMENDSYYLRKDRITK